MSKSVAASADSFVVSPAEFLFLRCIVLRLAFARTLAGIENRVFLFRCRPCRARAGDACILMYQREPLHDLNPWIDPSN